MSGRHTWHAADGFTTRTLVVVTHLGSSRNQGALTATSQQQQLQQQQHNKHRAPTSDEKGLKKTLDKARQNVTGSVMILCGGKWKEFYPELMMAAHAAILSPSSTWVHTDDWRDMKLRFSSAERTPPVVVTDLACGIAVWNVEQTAYVEPSREVLLPQVAVEEDLATRLPLRIMGLNPTQPLRGLVRVKFYGRPWDGASEGRLRVCLEVSGDPSTVV